MKTDFLFQCNYCYSRFKTERGFLKHHCKQMLRDEDFKSLEGQAAFLFYKSWLVEKHHARIVSAGAFKSSKYYTAFRKFVDFAKRVDIPDANLYITLMVSKKIEPPHWSSEQAYGKYLNHITRKLPTEKWIDITVNTLFDIADVGEVAIGDVFTVLEAYDVIRLLEQRKISPWILLNSKKFAVFFKNKTTVEERIILENLVNPDYWKPRFLNNKKDLELAKDCVSALELD